MYDSILKINIYPTTHKFKFISIVPKPFKIYVDTHTRGTAQIVFIIPALNLILLHLKCVNSQIFV